MRIGYRGLAPTAKFRRPLTGTCEAGGEWGPVAPMGLLL